MAETELAERPAETDADDGVAHVVCPCNDDLALCGEDVEGARWDVAYQDPECALCAVIADHQPRCFRCGRTWEECG